ncbi:PIN domain-containing protein [Bosea sp. (in: a-proteobacteria)]|uniref:type II toxin-antitoxin system VapC family toxin n=1 Tax=Bosea sp. (in: a-proteobacteria) TaxID=1871050 RepID=UPI002734A627|nr:PIN domain-containing protein [Bosea sp. (in: a-proteobacteria)]MDP3258720.1 PIN domain-containing protein [Bosea sp. (in: a-proteobacteria)]
MILADSSVWIAHLKGQESPSVAKLDALIETPDLLLGDLVLLELLQGARDDRHASAIDLRVRRFPLVQMFDPQIARAAARNYRELRRLGVTVRKTADLIIATFCIEHGHALLHADRDFGPFAEHLGLMTA